MDEQRVMTAFAVLLIGCFLCFGAGFLVGATGREAPRTVELPANYSPIASQLKDCYQLLTTEIMGLKQQVAQQCPKPAEGTAH